MKFNFQYIFFIFITISSCSFFENKISSININSPSFNILQKKISFETSSKSDAFVSYWIKGLDSIYYSSTSFNNLSHEISLLYLKSDTEYSFLVHYNSDEKKLKSDTLSFFVDSLPDFLPDFTLLKEDDYEFNGYIFLRTQMDPGIQLLLDDDANIVWYHKSDTSLSRPFDISSSDSYLSLYNPSLIYKINFIGDTLLKIDTKGEILHHELTNDINNNIIALTYEYKTFDLSNFGGGEKDSIKGDGLVVYDSTGNLSWKWNVFDHEDPLSYENINSLKNDWTHGNGIGVTHDNNYVLSLRTLNQLWKIDSKNGRILWKLGLNGNIPIEESSIFYAQHAIHEIGIDTFLLFDNGTRKERMISRALIFSMREDQFKLLNSIELPKDLFSFKQGSVYRFDQDKFLFCSSTNSKIVITDIYGKILWNLSSNFSFYRAYHLNTNK